MVRAIARFWQDTDCSKKRIAMKTNCRSKRLSKVYTPRGRVRETVGDKSRKERQRTVLSINHRSFRPFQRTRSRKEVYWPFCKTAQRSIVNSRPKRK